MKQKIGLYSDIAFLASLLVIPFIPNFGRIEVIGPQLLFMSGCIVSYLTIKTLTKELSDFKLNYAYISYLGFLIFAIISIFTAFNISASLIELSGFLTTFTYLILVYSILKKNQFKIDHLIYFLLGFMTIETSYILYIFIDNFDFLNPPFRIREYQGLAYNQNVASLSILAKIPFILYFLFGKRVIFFRIYLYILLFVAVFDIFVIASRSANYGIFLIWLILIILFPLKKIFDLKFLKIRTIGLITLTVIFAGISNLYLLQNSNQKINVVERSLNLQEKSTNYRLELWSSAIEILKDNPFIGVGIGNYKVNSLEYVKSMLKDYTIPFHTHNDFLQIFSETGILGGLFYFFFFILPFLYFIFFRKKIIPGNEKLAFFLLLSVIAILIDSFFNFPRYRPYSLINFIIVFSFFFSIFLVKNDIVVKKQMVLILLVVNIFSLYVHNRNNNSFKDQYPLYVEYNFHQDKIITPIPEILMFEDEIPNISSLTIPIKIAKARYLFLDGQYKKAKSLIFKGQKHNPYLGIGDNLLAKIYLRENKLDSASFYSKRSINKLPNNILHITTHQIILERLGDIDEANNLFEEKKHLKDETIWQNYAIGITTFKKKKNLEYTDKEMENINKALQLFPDNQLIKASNKIIDYGESLLPIADELDLKALNHFTNNEYEQAIENWLRASELIKDEDSYLLNIAHSYLLMEKLDESNRYLNLIKERNLKSEDGKYEFLLSALFLKRENINMSCEYAKISYQKGYKNSSLILKTANCSI